MMREWTVDSDYLEILFTPPFERTEVRLCELLELNMDGVCKITVSLLRRPLDADRLQREAQASLEEATHVESQQHGLPGF